MYGKLTLRECHYLEFIRKKNMPLYGDVIQKLKGGRYGGLVNMDEKNINPDISDPYDL